MRAWPTTAPPLPKTNAAPSKTPSNTCARPTPPSTSRLSPRAGVQRKTVYKHRDLVAVIDQYRRQPTPPTSHRPTVKPASSRPCAPNWPQKTKRSKPSKQRRTNRNRPSPCSMDNSTYEPANTPRPLQTWHRNDRPTIPSPDLGHLLSAPFQAEVGQDFALGVGELRWEGLAGAVDGDGGAAQGPELFDDVGDGQAGLVLNGVGDGQSCEHDGQVRLDRLTHVVEDRSGGKIGLRHAE